MTKLYSLFGGTTTDTEVKAVEVNQIIQMEGYHVNADNLSFEIVYYSEKAIALFGDTKEIKDLLKAIGGKFNPRLTHNGEKQAGWVFSKTKREELQYMINLEKE
ncbi:MAG: hypothetical protein ACK5M7_17170 [Draconibacterium sp.]